MPSHAPAGVVFEEEVLTRLQRQLLEELIRAEDIRSYVLWYYTPMALTFTRHLEPQAVVYDCMDELSLFHGAPASLLRRESELFERFSMGSIFVALAVAHVERS